MGNQLLFVLSALVASVLGSRFGHEQTCKAGMTAHYYEGLNCESEVSSKVFTEEDVEKYTSCVEVEKVLWFDPPGTDKKHISFVCTSKGIVAIVYRGDVCTRDTSYDDRFAAWDVCYNDNGRSPDSPKTSLKFTRS